MALGIEGLWLRDCGSGAGFRFKASGRSTTTSAAATQELISFLITTNYHEDKAKDLRDLECFSQGRTGSCLEHWAWADPASCGQNP